MSVTLEQLQAQRDSILADMTGAGVVQHGDQSVTFKSQVELEAALARIDAEIAKLQSPQPKQFTIQTSRGL